MGEIKNLLNEKDNSDTIPVYVVYNDFFFRNSTGCDLSQR
jgi:hypothetical protein